MIHRSVDEILKWDHSNENLKLLNSSGSTDFTWQLVISRNSQIDSKEHNRLNL